MGMKTITVPLTLEEWGDRATRHAEISKQRALLEEEAKGVAADYRHRVKKLVEEEEKLRRAVLTHEEEREVDEQTVFPFPEPPSEEEAAEGEPPIVTPPPTPESHRLEVITPETHQLPATEPEELRLEACTGCGTMEDPSGLLIRPSGKKFCKACVDDGKHLKRKRNGAPAAE